MQEYVYNHLMNIPGVLVELDEVGNIYATKGISETYPCCVAHMDEVHKKRTKGYRVIEGEDVIIGYDVDTKEQMGIGADDQLFCRRQQGMTDLFYPILKETLTKLGVSTIDYMVFTHPHNDHQNGAFSDCSSLESFVIP